VAVVKAGCVHLHQVADIAKCVHFTSKSTNKFGAAELCPDSLGQTGVIQGFITPCDVIKID